MDFDDDFGDSLETHKDTDYVDPPKRGLSSVLEWACQSNPLATSNKTMAYTTLVLLLLISLFSQSLRWSIPALQTAGLQCESCTIKSSHIPDGCEDQCIDLDDAQMGTISGPTFSLSTTIASIPLGLMADKFSRVRLLMILMIAWGVFGLALSYSQTFFQLFFASAMIGVCQAVVNPASYSLLADFFPPNQRGRVMGLLSAVLYLAYDGGLIAAGIAQFSSWRIAVAVLAIPSLLLAIPSLLMREPARGLSDGPQDVVMAPLLSDEVSYMSDSDTGEGSSFSRPPPANKSALSTKIESTKPLFYSIFCNFPFICLWIAAMLRLCAGFVQGAWMPAFYSRVHGMEPYEISLYLSLVLTIGGLLGSNIGGWVADLWSSKDPGGKAWLCAASSVLSLPFLLGQLLFPSATMSLISLTVASFFGEMWFGPSIAIVQELVHPSVRGIASSIYLLSIGLSGFSSMLVGWMNIWFAIPAPYQSTVVDSELYDPTRPMAIVILSCTLLSSIAYAVEALLLRLKHRKIEEYTSAASGHFEDISFDS